MKKNIHPKYEICEVVCACGNRFITISTKPSIKVEICSNCHPFYTGKHKIIDTEGRVDKFNKKYAQIQQTSTQSQTKKKAEIKAKVVPAHRKSTPTGVVKKIPKKIEKEPKKK
jgi:large subunit ribosomal protein L31